ncbi:MULTISPECIES: hypothetical protein [unclassified Chryseobacterium]|uniref:hypothetical protein n=1 Tax=unclassified Chryseobacterium TaxID=2593645 RepID=UPI000D86A0DE|nr:MULTISPECIES: hypothetical protein [unclassified Chryseobacterium]PWW28756.1 hypothetical protein DEU40_104268 [Chryseobacterium sp. AG844]
MKKLILGTLLCLSISVFAQSGNSMASILQKIKSQSKIDTQDKTVYDLMDEFYQKNLQADNDEMTPEFTHKLRKAVSDSNTKNIHLLYLFLMYQQHISQAVAEGKSPNPVFQIETMHLLESETKEVYGKLPAIIYIFKAEALDSGSKKEEAKMTVASGLKEYPDSVPLKVYSYLNTKDENLRKDLTQNHPNHWMVQQFGIQ